MEHKIKLDELTDERTRGIMFRSRCNWLEQGERNSKYFYALESAKYNVKTSYVLLDENGCEVADQELILNMQRNFYTDLYKKDNSVFEVTGLAPNHVSEQAKISLGEKFSEGEISDAIMELKNNKCPGSDGLPVDFYKVFWSQIRKVLIDAIFFAYETGKIHRSASQGILNLIPKKGKDTRLLKNLRPITLLNTDYKVIEKVIVNRIIPELSYIIHEDQKGFIPNRKIAHNIRKIFDVVSQIGDQDPGVILQIDFQKAFDKCSMDAVTGSLKFFNFPEYLTEWVKILYTDFKVKIQNNGFFSPRSILRDLSTRGRQPALLFLSASQKY